MREGRLALEMPTPDAPYFREYTHEDRDAVVALLQRTFQSAIGFTRFETGNPLGNGIRMAGFLGGRLIAFNHYIPWIIPSPNGPILTHQAAAAAVDAEVRGHGVYAKLLDAGEEVCRERGIGFLLGFPNPAAYNSYIRRGWQDIATMRLWVMRLPLVGLRKEPDSPLPGRSFQDWRRAAAGFESTTSHATGFDVMRLTYRRTTASGIPIVKIADVLAPAGNRVLAELPGMALKVRGPAVALARCPASRGLPKRWFTEIPRRWNTPVVVKQLAGSKDEFAGLAQTAFMYGDIDAT